MAISSADPAARLLQNLQAPRAPACLQDRLSSRIHIRIHIPVRVRVSRNNRRRVIIHIRITSRDILRDNMVTLIRAMLRQRKQAPVAALLRQ
jgi:hypothetical protein